MSIITIAILFACIGCIIGIQIYILVSLNNVFSKMELMSTFYKESYQRFDELEAGRQNVYDTITTAFNTIIEKDDLIVGQYKSLYEQYKNIYEQYKFIKDAYDKQYKTYHDIIDVINELNDQYSVTSDQFEEIGKGQADIYSKVVEIHDDCMKACNNSKYFLDYSDFCLKGMNPSYQEALNTDPMYNATTTDTLNVHWDPPMAEEDDGWEPLSEEEDDTNKTNE